MAVPEAAFGELVGTSAWTDAAVFSAAGIPTAVFGSCGDGAPAPAEWVDLGVAGSADVYLAVARRLCA